MIELYENFIGYLQLNIWRIKWIFAFGFLFMVLFYALLKKGYANEYKNPYQIICLGAEFSLSCSFIFVLTLFGRNMQDKRKFALLPFASYIKVIFEGNMEILLQILMNIAMYIPLGFLLPCCFRLFEKYRYVILGTFCGSLIIELIQLVFRMGLFEVDDVINNTLGAVIGMVIYMIFKRGKNEHNKQKIS